MKHIILCVSLVLVCLHLTGANQDSSRGVASIHRRITAVPSGRGSTSKATENRAVPTIYRTIETLHRSRRVANHVAPDDYEKLRVRELTTPYPKHHLLQSIPVSLGEFQPEEDLDTTTAPYTENHHSWKKSSVMLN